jgi:hypothetical protein
MSAERGGQKSPLEVHDLVGASAKDEASPRTLDAGRRCDFENNVHFLLILFAMYQFICLMHLM